MENIVKIINKVWAPLILLGVIFSIATGVTATVHLLRTKAKADDFNERHYQQQLLKAEQEQAKALKSIANSLNPIKRCVCR